MRPGEKPVSHLLFVCVLVIVLFLCFTGACPAGDAAADLELAKLAVISDMQRIRSSEAVAILDRVISSSTDASMVGSAELQKIEALSRGGSFAEARALADSVISRYPGTWTASKALFLKGIAFLENRKKMELEDYISAYRCFRQVLSDYADVSDVAVLSSAEYRMGRVLRAATQDDPAFRPAILSLAKTEKETALIRGLEIGIDPRIGDDLKTCTDKFNSFCLEYPSYPLEQAKSAANLIGRFTLHLSIQRRKATEDEKAIVRGLAQKALAAGQGDYRVLTRLAQCYQDFDEANGYGDRAFVLQLMDGAASLQNRFIGPVFLYKYGICLNSAGRKDEAEAAWTRAITGFPDNGFSWCIRRELAEAAVKRKDFTAAENHLKGIAQDRRTAAKIEGYHLLAGFYRSTGNTGAAATAKNTLKALLDEAIADPDVGKSALKNILTKMKNALEQEGERQ